MKIYEKICDIQSEIDHICKKQENRQQGFKYRGIDQVYNDVHALLSKHRVFSFPLSIESESVEREGKTSILRFTIAKITYRFCADDGSFLDVTVLGEAMDSGDKSCGKAMSYAHKYAFFQLFSIPTDGDNDPDATTHELAKRYTPPAKTSEVSDAQAKRAFAIASSKGIPVDRLKAQVLNVCGSDDIKKLTRDQYNSLCERMEMYQKSKESVSAQNEIDQAVDHMEVEANG